MAILKNLEAAELLVPLDRKRHLKLAPAGDPGDAKEIDDRHLAADQRAGKVIEEMAQAGRLEVLPGSHGSDISSIAVGQEQYPGLHGWDVIVDLEGAAGVDVPAGPAIPAGAFLLSVQANLEELVVAGGTSLAVGVGSGAADPDLYGKTGDLLKNSKPGPAFFRGAALAALGAPVTVHVSMVTLAGAAGDTAALSGKVRVKVSWIEPPAPLPDAA
jgi:hypothetical protein